MSFVIKCASHTFFIGFVANMGVSLIGLKNEARASGFIETIGTSTAVGLVLGASTLPFYDQPADHLGMNIGIGTALGVVAGLGIWGVDRLNRPSNYEKFISQKRSPEKLIAPKIYGDIERDRIFRNQNRKSGFWTPVVSYRW